MAGCRDDLMLQAAHGVAIRFMEEAKADENSWRDLGRANSCSLNSTKLLAAFLLAMQAQEKS
jgi:hypothetical protein